MVQRVDPLVRCVAAWTESLKIASYFSSFYTLEHTHRDTHTFRGMRKRSIILRLP